MDFAKNLQSIRKAANLSQESVADQLHISRQAVSKWEQGQSTPDVETCLKLCEVLNVTPNRLLLGTEVEGEKTPQEKMNHLKTFFVISSIFLMVVCACGTIMLICNLYNGKIFEPNIHTQATLMIWGSMLAFAVMVVALLVHSLRKKRDTERK